MGPSSNGHERALKKISVSTAAAVCGFLFLTIMPLWALASGIVIDVATGEVQSVPSFIAPPINGLGLLIVGIVLLALEAHLFTFGALGALGVAAVSAGLLLWYIVGGISLIIVVPTIAFFVLIAVGLAVVGYRTRKMKFGHGVDSLIGKSGVIMEVKESRGMVSVQGEIWAFETSSAADSLGLSVGEKVQVINQKNLVLVIGKTV